MSRDHADRKGSDDVESSETDLAADEGKETLLWIRCYSKTVQCDLMIYGSFFLSQTEERLYMHMDCRRIKSFGAITSGSLFSLRLAN